MDKNTILEIVDQLEDVPDNTKLVIRYDDETLWIKNVDYRNDVIYIDLEETLRW